MYTLKSRVRYSETDENGRLTLWGMMNYLQDCCTMQAEDLGIGISYLRKNNLGWIVTSYQIKIKGELPKIGDWITVKTWPYRFRGMLGYRNFTIEDEKNQVIVEADSLWVLMDILEQKPVRLPDEMQQAYSLFEALPGEWDVRKRWEMTTGVLRDTFSVSNMHLDTNHHMNNAKYVEAAATLVPPEKKIGQIWISYMKQAVLHDKVVCYSQEEEDGMLVRLSQGQQEDYCLLAFQYCK